MPAWLHVYLLVIGAVAAVIRFALPRLIESIQQFVENQETYIRAFETSLTALFEKTGVEKPDISPLMEGISSYVGRLDEKMDVLAPEGADDDRAARAAGFFLELPVYYPFIYYMIRKC